MCLNLLQLLSSWAHLTEFCSHLTHKLVRMLLKSSKSIHTV